jgi:sulfite reductase alpha subunit-like flavoprotein
LYHARELTKPGAEKRTIHFDIDVTDYPAESGDVDFVVGGAIGVCPKNKEEEVDDIFNQLGIPKSIRDKKITLHTTKGRWPTIWGDDQPRDLITTRRELLSWCSDIQSYPPTKPLFRLLAEYATEPNEKKILMFLSSAQGQGAFCDLRTGSYITVSQLFHAFPSSQPPLDHLLSVLNTLMPRFYSLSQDPQISCQRQDTKCRRLIEIAVSVAETEDWRGGTRTGVGSGYLERLARQAIDAERKGIDPRTLDLHVPMFRGLMANPLAKRFASDGPMLLIGAGVGIAPFRGFVQRRLQSANCANKVWVLQGIRDSLLDELYSGEWGVEEDKVRKVVQSRRGESKYVQEEVRHQADLVWFVINALDGRVFVCGSGKGMGEGVEAALVDVAMAKGNLNREEAEHFWKNKKEAGQYIAVSCPFSGGKEENLLTTHRKPGKSSSVYIILQLGLSAFHSLCQRITRVDLGWTTVVRLTEAFSLQGSCPVLVYSVG